MPQRLTFWKYSWARLLFLPVVAIGGVFLIDPRMRWGGTPIFVVSVGYLLWMRVVYFNSAKAHVWVWHGPLPVLVRRIPRDAFKFIGLVERVHEASSSGRGGVLTLAIDAARVAKDYRYDPTAPIGYLTCDVILEGEQHIGPEYVDEKVERLLLKSFTGYERARKYADALAPVIGLPVRDHIFEPEGLKKAQPR